MGSTPSGLPYPVGTDKVVDGDNAIKALAEAIHARGGGLLLQAGGNNIVPDVAGRFIFNFPKPFAAQPWLAMTPGSSPPEGMIVLAIDNPLQVTTTTVHGVAMMIVPGAATILRTAPFFMTYIAVGTAP